MRLCNTQEQFGLWLNQAGGNLVIVCFLSDMDETCGKLFPVLEELEDACPSALFFKVEVNSNSETTTACKVKKIPTFQFYKNLQKVGEISQGNIQNLKKMIQKYS